MIRCEDCGAAVTAETKTNRYGSRYTYYHCTWKRPCRQRSIEVRDLERQIAAALERLVLPPQTLTWLLRQLDEAYAADATTLEAVRDSLRSSIMNTERQLSTLTQLRIRDSISEDEFVSERATVQADLARLRSRESQLGGDIAVANDTAAAALLFSSHASAWFDAGSPDVRRAILSIVGSNFQLQDKVLTIEAQKPFRLIDEGQHIRPANPTRFEPTRNGSTKLRLAPAEAAKSKLLAQLNDVRTFFTSGDYDPKFKETLHRIVREHLSPSTGDTELAL
jgi:hypothetical protein